MRLSFLYEQVGKPARKQYTKLPNGSVKEDSYANGFKFQYFDVEYDTFDEFVDHIKKLEDMNCFLVRGRPCEGIDTSVPIVRRLYSDENYQQTFEEDPNGLDWVMLDLDNITNEWGITPATKQEAEDLIKVIIHKNLPESFHSARCWYQWSNSMFVKTNGWETLKLHLFYLLDEPKTDTYLQQWAISDTDIDESPFRTVQPNYVAKPLFHNMEDPLGDWRSGLLQDDYMKNDRVKLAYKYQKPSVFKKKQERLVKMAQEAWKQLNPSITNIDYDYVSAPVQRIAEIGVNGRLHMPITRSAASWIVCCGANPDREEWKRLVRERVAVSGHPQAQHRASDKYLDAQWRTAQRKYSPDDPTRPSRPRELIINTLIN